MPSKTLHGGVEYEIAKGRALHGGTGYDIQEGRTLVGGVGYDISHTFNLKTSGSFAYVEIYLNGTRQHYALDVQITEEDVIRVVGWNHAAITSGTVSDGMFTDINGVSINNIGAKVSSFGNGGKYAVNLAANSDLTIYVWYETDWAGDYHVHIEITGDYTIL